MGWGASYSSFHCDQLGDGYALMCIHVGLGGQALLHDIYVHTETVTRRVARGVYKAKDSGTYISFGGVVIIILHMAE